MQKKYDYIVVGEYGPPWTSMSKASMAKVMEAILRTDSELTGSYVSQIQYAPRCSVLYSVKVPSDKLEEFKELVGYAISRHSDIQLGNEIIPSVKQVIYELSDNKE